MTFFWFRYESKTAMKLKNGALKINSETLLSEFHATYVCEYFSPKCSEQLSTAYRVVMQKKDHHHQHRSTYFSLYFSEFSFGFTPLLGY